MSPPAPASLSSQIPPSGTLEASDLLDRFVAWVASTGITLYEAQEEAILALLEGKHVVLNTPTGSGKSLVATFLHFQALAAGKRSFYTCPIKALVNEKFFALCETFGPENVGMMTGDAGINTGAPIVCCTAEILVNYAVRDDDPGIDAVVMDEFHYYADRDRGVAWQVPLLTMEKTTFLLMSATLGDTTPIEEGIREVTGREAVRIRSTERPVPLEFEYRETALHETIENLVESGRAPVYLVNFTQRAAAEQAQNLTSVNFSTREEKDAIRDALEGIRFTSPGGKDFQRFVRHGIGLHHAGLLPKYRLTVEKLAQKGLLKVISGTDTLGMGINIPLKTVLFTQLCKYDGTKTALLTARDFHQISGRAGRKGFDERGYVLAQAPEHVVENKKLAEKAKSGKKVVKRQPPTKGFVPWDKPIFDRLQIRDPEPLESRFEVNFGLLLSILQSRTTRRGGGYGLLVQMIARSHEPPKAKQRHRREAAMRFRTLRNAGLIELIPIPGHRGRDVRPSTELQRDFSLLQTLSLYLLDSLPRISPEVPTYALDVLSQVEAILENPDVVLYKQLARLKTEKVMEMKRQGIEYDERMAELEKLEYPKPNRDFIYATFNEFAAKHPWVGAENIRPKSVAREMLERFISFEDYVRDYGLERSEGVLLRHLSQVYKTLEQSVPETYRTDEIEDVIAALRTMIRGVDSSLLDEWEQRKDPAAPRPEREIPREPVLRPRDPSADPKAFAARVRTDLHRLLRALADRRWDAAAAAIANPEEWPATRFEEALAPYFAEHRAIDVTPIARRPDRTLIKPTGDRQWDAVQTLVPPPVRKTIADAEGEDPPEDPADWAIECEIDLSVSFPEDAPWLTLRRIGT